MKSACVEYQNIIEFSISGRVLEYSRLSSMWVSHQGISIVEVCWKIRLPRMGHVVRSLNLWNNYVRAA